MKSKLVMALTMLAVVAEAKVVTKTIEYKEGSTTLSGTLAFDDEVKGPMPGVLVVHDYMGEGEYTTTRIKQLAEMGYVAFAADIYGKDVRAKDPKEASSLSGKYKGDRPLLRKRAIAGLDVLKKQPQTDSKKLAAIGYCFGGTTVLEMARAGAKVNGVVSFHGGLDAKSNDAKNIKTKILVLHGAVDPHVPQEQVNAFQKEMNDAKVDYQFIAYSNAVHAFTVPGAGNDPSKGAAYNKEADRRSFVAMTDFFKEIFN